MYVILWCYLCFNLGGITNGTQVGYNLNQDPRLTQEHRNRNAAIVELESRCNPPENPARFLIDYINCTENSIGTDYFRNEYLDEKVFGYIIDGVCSNHDLYAGCLDQFYISLNKNCISSDKSNLNLSGSDGIKKLLNLVCADNGKNLISAFTRGNEKCVKKQQRRIQNCIEQVDLVWTISIGLVLEPVFYFDEYMCRNYAKFETCILNSWQDCEPQNNNTAYVTQLLNAVKGNSLYIRIW